LSISAEKPKVTDLIPFSREVFCDDTLREFNQVIRYDIVYDRPLRVQLLLDRRHKFNKALSKPLGYFRISSVDQLLRLGTNALAAATILAFFQSNRTEPSIEENHQAVQSLLKMVGADVELTTQTILRDLKLRGMAEGVENV
jgi:hypothetical protein